MKTTSDTKSPPPEGKRPAIVASASTLGTGATSEAGRRAAAILEVLAGERSAPQAAAILGLSLPYYYLLERKALTGLVQACEPQPKGPPGPSPEKRLAELERDLGRAQRECQRQAALVRATQRAVGLPAAPAPRPKAVAKNGKSLHVRRPAARALRAAQTLRKNSAGPETVGALEPTAPGSITDVPQEAKHGG